MTGALMSIAELFARDPCRTIKPVIRAGDRSPEVLGHELDEYVVTPEIDRYLRDILGQFIESRPEHGLTACAAG